MKLKRKKIWRLTTAAKYSMKIPFTHFHFPPSFFNSTTFNSIIWFSFVVSFVRLLIVSTTLWSVFLFSRQLCSKLLRLPSLINLPGKFSILFSYCRHFIIYCLREFVVIHSGRLLHSLFSFSSLHCFIRGFILFFFREKGIID